MPMPAAPTSHATSTTCAASRRRSIRSSTRRDCCSGCDAVAVAPRQARRHRISQESLHGVIRILQMKVGLVGLGRMGAAIGERLNERGCEVVAWDRNPRARELQGKRGVRVVNGPREVADEAEVVLSIITEDKGVREVFTAPD